MTPRTTQEATPRRGRRRASHSMDTVIGETIALLDESGEAALTFRALAARLGGGVASIYWYVDNKDELLDRATDHILGDVVDRTDAFTDTDDPIADLRAIAIALFDAVVERPWLGRYLMRDNGTQPNGMHMYEALGRQVMRLGLNPRETFHGVSAVLGFVIGTATDLGQQVPAEVRDGTVSGEELIARAADDWRSLDPDEHPFVHYVVDEFATHDDADQFRAGLDLVLAGLRLQAGM
ncbi:TetR/AcrR family transcriptional regulator C-terminal domain-containing protein [Gordonia sp. HY442]|uniref:TetR/AcrR family transcriptional regulator n=1 Tax=Gordonia zhenghanii TaxID=2911516 RepID=UPI001F013731|nr:TetR/AcrR family transcriptional regulator C-terminal domain-containing protein [Gordonia zhenghanii]MCF8601944.1 TetR/AcrR family transcriptional regulator C-terminal domain-containing protein [Gordonia zhenghanii]MCF8602012.1 TetR/AcrR family transcriptional regulator C-terminal domain-containing protein [Gordonia zhenghanii]